MIMQLRFGYGSGEHMVEIPEKNLLGILTPNAVDAGLAEEAEVKRALANPTGTLLLRDIVKPGEKIAIVTSDITRPMPTGRVLPALLEELFAGGARKEDITVVFGLGSHRRHTEEEKKKLLGEAVYREIRCEDSDEKDCVRLGTTVRGTPVDIMRTVAEADRRICLGNIEYHYFAGYSGGGKAIMPGVSTRSAIQANHSLMVQPQACAGRMEDNPIRQDIEEAAALCGVDFILNVVLDEHKRIIKAVAGDMIEAHREGCRFLDDFYKVRISRQADIVIVSQGGAPKDLNLYQSQKSLDNAKHAVRDGGIIILAGSCREGLGEAVFARWMENYRPDEMIAKIQEDFQLGGHKAAAIAMVMQKAEIYLVSEMDGDYVKRMHFTPFSRTEDAVAAAFGKLGKDASVLAMPYGGSTLPVLSEDDC